jgi:hypothetical protein
MSVVQLFLSLWVDNCSVVLLRIYGSVGISRHKNWREGPNWQEIMMSALSAEFDEKVANGDMSPDMSATYPAKNAPALFPFVDVAH